MSQPVSVTLHFTSCDAKEYFLQRLEKGEMDAKLEWDHTRHPVLDEEVQDVEVTVFDYAKRKIE
jgi:hypothetical protein